MRRLDNWLLAKFWNLCNTIQSLTGILSFRLVQWCSISVAVYGLLLTISTFFPKFFGHQPRNGIEFILFVLIGFFWAVTEAKDAEKFKRIEKEWTSGDGSVLPQELFISIQVSMSRLYDYVRPTCFFSMTGIWSLLLLTSDSPVELLQNLLYIPWIPKLYLVMVIPQPKSQSKIEALIESFQPQPIPIEVKE